MGKNTDRIMILIMVIMAIVLLWRTGTSEKKLGTESSITTQENTENVDLHFFGGQTVRVRPGTIVYQSSENAGSGKYCELNSQNYFIVNGYSFWDSQKGRIDNYQYCLPEEIEENKFVVIPREELTLLLHLCEITEEGQLKIRGWTPASNVFIESDE